MTGMEVTAEELKSLLVDQLEVIDEAAFEKVRAIAIRYASQSSIPWSSVNIFRWDCCCSSRRKPGTSPLST